MTSYLSVNTVKNFPKDFLSEAELTELIPLPSKRGREDVIAKLVEAGTIIRLEKGKYLVGNREVDDFATAQFLYNPSYISLETALNYHGVLPQFPFVVSSVTTKRTTSKQVLGKEFVYTHISKKLFTGYAKQGAALVATPDKALFDYLYLASKGLKPLDYLSEMNLTLVDKEKMPSHLRLLSGSSANNVTKLIHKFI